VTGGDAVVEVATRVVLVVVDAVVLLVDEVDVAGAVMVVVVVESSGAAAALAANAIGTTKTPIANTNAAEAGSRVLFTAPYSPVCAGDEDYQA